MKLKNRLSLYVILFLLCMTAIVPVKAAGELDPSFKTFLANNGGGVTESIIQPDGKTLIYGTFEIIGTQTKIFVARLNPDGSLDASFNPPVFNRLYSYSYAGQTPVKCVRLQSDGKILVAGLFDFQGRVTGLIRLNADGSPDNVFNNLTDVTSIFDGRGLAVFPDDKIVVTGEKNGLVLNILLNADGTTNRQSPAPVTSERLQIQPDGKVIGFYDFNNIYRTNQDLSIDSGFQPALSTVSNTDTQPDGKIVAVGGFSIVNGAGFDRVVRFNTDGTIDYTFNTSRPVHPNDNVNSVRVLPDGKILIGGFFTQINGITSNKIARLNSDGSLDTSFNSAIPPVEFRAANDIRIEPNGKIIVCYFSQTYRLNSDGSLDNTFNAERGRSPQAGDKLAVQADGKILVSGDFSNVNGINKSGVIRLNADGTLDTSFSLSVPGLGNIGASVIKIQPDGKIIVGSGSGAYRFDANGAFELQFPDVANIYTAAVAPDGKIYFGGVAFVKSYSPAGTLINANLSAGDSVYDMVAQPDSKVVFAVGGQLRRVNADGTLDTGFQSMPRAINSNIFSLSVQPDGKILFGGPFTMLNNNSNRKYLARLNANGSVDPSFDPVVPNTVYETTTQPNGKIIVHAGFNNGYTIDGSLLRLESNGARDASFNTVTTDDSITGLELQNNGNILITGRISRVNGIPKIGIARILNIPVRSKFDFDGDNKTDIGIFRPTTGAWWINSSITGATTAAAFGASGDKLVPADFTGDGKADIAYFRPSTSEWVILRSENNTYYGFPFGASGDLPAPGDFDGDGKADPAVFRPSNGSWYILRSSDGAITSFQFGTSNDQPIVADYDGDGKDDAAVTRINNGNREWWISKSGGGTFSVQFGQTEDKTVSGDYTGDGKADVAFWRPSNGTWYIIRSEDFTYYGFPFGASSDIPSPGDYDGDGKTDAAVFRPSNANWYLQRSTAGFIAVAFGANGDQPIPNSFVR